MLAAPMGCGLADGSQPLQPELVPAETAVFIGSKALMEDVLSGRIVDESNHHSFGASDPGKRSPLFNFASAAAEAIRAPPAPTRAACSATSLPEDERLLLTAEALFFHGSTALHQVLMSAPQVATLCPGRSWECEARLDEHVCARCREQYTPGEEPGPKNDVGCLACKPQLSHECANYTTANLSVAQSLQTNLELFDEYWAVQPDRKVLMVKWAPLYSARCGLAAKWWSPVEERWQSPGERSSLLPEDASPVHIFGVEALSQRLRTEGVRTLRWAAVFMHRPWCMWNTSSNARSDRRADLRAWAEEELNGVEMLVTLHKSLVDRGVPVLVFTYAQLLWQQEQLVGRVRRFAPCLGGDVDLEYIPKLGEDIFEPNMLKTEGSIRDYSELLTPGEVSVDGTTLRCTAPSEELYEGLHGTQRERAAAAEAYLTSKSLEESSEAPT